VKQGHPLERTNPRGEKPTGQKKGVRVSAGGYLEAS
jgi:hypothetical protein